MVAVETLELDLPDADATSSLGAAMAAVLAPGDTVLLTGDVGAGKTHLARSIIQARLRAAGLQIEDVPSPTFTLVQVYEDGTGEIWHTDLYRVSNPDELIELGLDEAFETAIVLVEWPDRLQGYPVDNSVDVFLEASGDGRRASIKADSSFLSRLRAIIEAHD